MLVHKAVQEGQASRLAAERAVAHTREPYVSSVCRCIEMGDHSAACQGVIIVDLLGHICPELFYICKIALRNLLEF